MKEWPQGLGQLTQVSDRNVYSCKVVVKQQWNLIPKTPTTGSKITCVSLITYLPNGPVNKKNSN